MMVLNTGNITFLDIRDNEVALALNVVEENVYLMSPQVALELALQLEHKARDIIARQQESLNRYARAKAGRP